MSPNDDDDLTDITSLPDLDPSEDDDNFSSLEDMASDIGLDTSELEQEDPPEVPGPPDIEDQIPEFTANHDISDFQNEESDFGSSEDDMDFGSTNEEDDFGSTEEETDFGSTDDEADFGSTDEGTDFGSLDEEADFGSTDEEADFGRTEEEADFGSTDDDVDFGSTDDEADFGSTDDEADFGSIEEEADFGSTEVEEETNFEPTPEVTQAQPTRAYEEIAAKRKELETTTSTLIPEEELIPSATIEEKPQKTRINNLSSEEQTHSTPPEDFEEFKNFAKSMAVGDYTSEGNPPFSIIIKNLVYKEDVEAIADLLIEYKIIDQSDKDQTMTSLERGQLLIPRLSEYAAITICHKIRRFDAEILMGLTEEINPPKSYNSNDRGLSSKRTIYNNKRTHIEFDANKISDEILTTTLQQLRDFQVVKYIGVATESKKINYEDLSKLKGLEEEILNQFPDDQRSEIELAAIKRENHHASSSQNSFNYQDLLESNQLAKKQVGLDFIYNELITNMKSKAKTSKANAVIGLNFSITPISIEDYLNTGPQYQILCTGNLVWVERI